jgi:hypothetical protein
MGARGVVRGRLGAIPPGFFGPVVNRLFYGHRLFQPVPDFLDEAS